MARLDEVDDLGVVGRQQAGFPTLINAHQFARDRLERAYLYLVAGVVARNAAFLAAAAAVGGQNDMANGNDMYIDGGGKRRKRRKSKKRKSKKRKSKRRKSKKRKSKKRRR